MLHKKSEYFFLTKMFRRYDMSKIEPTSSGDTEQLNFVSLCTLFPNEISTLVDSIRSLYLGLFPMQM